MFETESCLLMLNVGVRREFGRNSIQVLVPMSILQKCVQRFLRSHMLIGQCNLR